MEIATEKDKTELLEDADAVLFDVPAIELGEVKLENRGTLIGNVPLTCGFSIDEVKEESMLTVDDRMVLPMVVAEQTLPAVTIKEEPQELEEDDHFAQSTDIELSTVTIKNEPAESEDKKAEPGPSSSSVSRSSQMFICYHCGAAHHDKGSVAQHMGLHFSDLAVGLHRCPHCDFYGREHSLKEHALRKHGNEKPFLCKMCSYKADFPSKVLRHVNQTHQEHHFHCSQCTSTFRFKYGLMRHYRENHRSENTLYSCSLCDFKSLDKEGFDRHKQLCHMMHKCLQCGYRCKFDFELERHFSSTHAVITCKFCNFTASFPGQLKKHVSKCHPQKRIKCSLCPKLLKSSHELRKHRNSVHYAGASCPHCDHKSKNSKYLVNHIMRAHVEKSIKCSLCSHTFSFQYQLRAHEADYHFHGNTYTCSRCPVTCATASKLRYHENKEHGIQIKSCTLCDFKCTSRQVMTNHTNLLHGISKTYRCAHCGYKAERRGNMILHSKLHLPDGAYNCGICGRAYKRKQSLELHKRAHETKQSFPLFTMDQL